MSREFGREISDFANLPGRSDDTRVSEYGIGRAGKREKLTEICEIERPWQLAIPSAISALDTAESKRAAKERRACGCRASWRIHVAAEVDRFWSCSEELCGSGVRDRGQEACSDPAGVAGWKKFSPENACILAKLADIIRDKLNALWRRHDRPGRPGCPSLFSSHIQFRMRVIATLTEVGACDDFVIHGWIE